VSFNRISVFSAKRQMPLTGRILMMNERRFSWCGIWSDIVKEHQQTELLKIATL